MSVIAVVAMAVVVVASWWGMRELVAHNAGSDLKFFVQAAERWQDTGTPYRVEQLAGTYLASNGISMLYPPVALYLFVPFTVLPAFLWWAIPLGILAWHVADARPPWWTWPILAILLFTPRSQAIIIWGNTTMWVPAIVVLGLRFAWASPLLLLKPTFAPFAFVGANRRAWWVGMAAFCLLSLAMLPLWFDYIDAMRNNVGPWPPGFLYSLPDYPLVALPIVAWLCRRSDGADARLGLRGLSGATEP